MKKSLKGVVLTAVFLAVSACSTGSGDEPRLTHETLGTVLTEKFPDHVYSESAKSTQPGQLGASVAFTEDRTRNLILGVQPKATANVTLSCDNLTNVKCEMFEVGGVNHRLVWVEAGDSVLSNFTLDAVKNDMYLMANYLGAALTKDPRELDNLDVSVEELVEVFADPRLTFKPSKAQADESDEFKWQPAD